MANTSSINAVIVSINADADLSARRVVKKTATGVGYQNSDVGACFGVITDSVEAGNAAPIAINGIVEVECGGTVTVGVAQMITTGGKIIDKTAGKSAIGIALDSGGSGDVVKLLIDRHLP